MRELPILRDNYYHLYNRGNLKQTLFYDESDYVRFIFLLIYLQSPVVLSQVNRYVSNYLKKGDFGIKEKEIKDIHQNRFVEIINFCLMPNHFHLTVKALKDDGISRYMHKVCNAYAKYFNTKYEKSGHVFQGAYKVKIITSDKQLTYLSAYIHRNPHEIKEWCSRSAEYPWSSYKDHKVNRWGELLNTNDIMKTFDSYDEYANYVESSGAKEDWGWEEKVQKETFIL